MSMKHKRGNIGFTMAEMLATIAIIGIVSALAFVSINQYLRSAYQQEMDETAKTIYIAAQNHLTVADSLGTLAKKTPGHTDTVSPDSTGANGSIFYYVLPVDSSDLSNQKSMLYTMLPPMSIDETVRTNGSYIIRYQYTGSVAKVLDVFYATPQSSGIMRGGFTYSFTDADFAELFRDTTYRTMDANGQEQRATFHGKIIGYYGGEDAASSKTTLATPKLEIYNAEVLAARLTNPNDFANCRFEFYAKGEVSGAISQPIVREGTRFTMSGEKKYIEAVFDSITESGEHFADLKSSNGIDFIPGENIKIQVFAIDTQTTRVSKSAARTTNSLFASTSSTSIADLILAFTNAGASSPASAPMARISNIRHLENMSYAVSAYDPTDADWQGKAPTAYEQTVDLSWSDFCTAVAGSSSGAGDVRVHLKPTNVYAAKHAFMPVDWTDVPLDYRGNGRAISDVEVVGTGNAGLFGTVIEGSISSLELINFKIATTGGNAGTLAGDVSNVAISNVFAHDESDNSTSYGVGALGFAGGLVGKMSGGTVIGCAAAEYVSGTDAAGGLIGEASSTTVSYSYSGGHTTQGKYNGGRYASNIAGGTVGGLIGLSNDSSASNCYSTCSVGGSTVGRFFGSGSATLANCYAVGAVNDEDWNATDIYGNTLSTESFDALIAGGKNNAVPYDATLTESYYGKYPYKAIAEMPGAETALGLSSTSGTTLVKHLKEHYGDWAKLVTTAVNR